MIIYHCIWNVVIIIAKNYKLKVKLIETMCLLMEIFKVNRQNARRSKQDQAQDQAKERENSAMFACGCFPCFHPRGHLELNVLWLATK